MSYFSSLGSILTQVGKVVLDEVDRALEDDTENDDRLETTEDDDFDNKDNDNELDIQHVKAPAIIGVDINSSSYTEEKISGVSLLESEDDSSFAEVNLDSDMKEVNESPHQCPYPELSLSYISNNKKGLSAEKGIESEKLSEVMKANIVDDDTDDPQEELAQRKLFQSPQIFITPASDGSSIDRRRLVELEVVVSKLREENSNLHKNLKAKTNELHSLTNQVTTLEAKASENEEYILEVQDQAKETELLQLKQMHDIVSGSKERFNQEISEKDSQIEQLKSQLAEAISSMQSIQVLPTADSQSQSNQLLSDELQSLQTIIRERDNTISHLNAQLQAGNEDIRLHEKKIYTLQQRVQALESTEVEIAQERATHKLNLIEYEDRLRTAEELVWAAKAENAELIFAHEIGTKKIEILQASEDQLKSESVLLQEELSQIKSLFAAQQEQLTQQEQIRSSVVIDSASASSNDLDSVLKALSLLVINIDESFTEEINWPEQALELLSTVSDANIRSSVQSLGLYVLRLQQQLRVFKDTQSAHEVVATVAKELGLSTDSHTGENTVTELEEKLSEMTTRYIEMTALSTSWVETFEQKLAEAHAVRELLEAQLQESQARDAERLVLEQKLAEAVSKRESVEKELRDMQMREVEVQQRAVNRDALEQQLLEVQQQFAQTESTLSTVKQQLAKSETETRQLNQVIKQLREVRKVSKEDVDTVTADRDELRARLTALETEFEKLHTVHSGAARDIENYSRLETEFKSSQEYVLSLEKSVESLTDTQAQIERGLIDKSKEAAVLRSDMVLLQQDLEQRNIECMNLKIAVDNLHNSQDVNAKRSTEKFAKQLKLVEAQLEEKLAQNDELWKVELAKQNELRVELEQKLSDEALLRRKAEIDMNTEKRRLQKLLEDAVNQLRHVREDVVDRTLVANLIVSYFQRNKSKDVLELISKMLSFSDEQKMAIGLGPTSLIASLLGTVVGKPAPPADIEGDNLAELWVNYLLNETDREPDEDGRTFSPGRSVAVPLSSREILEAGQFMMKS